MSTITRFEDIEGWKKARELTRAIYQLTGVGPFSRDFGLRDQTRRASVSIMANIAEGFGRGGNKECVAFLSNARGSCAEVKSHLYVATDNGMVSETEFEHLCRLATEVEGLVSGLMKYLARSPERGRKFVSSNREP